MAKSARARKRKSRSSIGTEVPTELLVSPPTVLVVDDEPLLTLGLRVELESYGLRVEVADSMRDALHCFRYGKNPLSALIIDGGLPEGSGYELVRRVRTIDALLPIVLITSLANRTIRNQFEGDHHLRFIERPYVYSRIQSTLETLGMQTSHFPADRYVLARPDGQSVEHRR